jgi:hypothetical protein
MAFQRLLVLTTQAGMPRDANIRLRVSRVAGVTRGMRGTPAQNTISPQQALLCSYNSSTDLLSVQISRGMI